MSEAPELHVVIVADAPDADLTAYHRLIAAADLLIAADGGARHLLALGFLPHAVIGDFDSLEPTLLADLATRCEVVRLPAEKDETDLELALMLAVERGATHISVLGALGGRPDMHLANHSLLALPILAGRSVALLADGWSIRLTRDSMVLHGAPGQRVSLIPLGDVTGVSTEGLRYPLRGEPLLFGPARGVSNELVAPTARITVASGALLVFVEANQ